MKARHILTVRPIDIYIQISLGSWVYWGMGKERGLIEPQNANKGTEREVPGAGNEALSRQTRNIPAANKISLHKLQDATSDTETYSWTGDTHTCYTANKFTASVEHAQWKLIAYLTTPYRLHTLYEGVSKGFRTGRLERELQMVKPSATRCSCIAILWVSLVSFAAITLCVASQRVFVVSV
jgi:hypothetical protein